MDETLKGVAEFHRAFGAYTAPTPQMPKLTDEDRTNIASVADAMEAIADYCLQQAARAQGTSGNIAFLRLQLLQEELGEFARGLEHEGLVEALDGLTDIQYVLDGSYLALGLADLKLPAHREVQRSNMTKLGEDGRPILNDAGRVVKGPNYEKPRLKELVYKYMYGGDVG